MQSQQRVLKRKLEDAEEEATKARGELVAREAKVHRLQKELRLSEEREQKSFVREMKDLEESNQDVLLVPKGVPKELEGVFQLAPNE